MLTLTSARSLHPASATKRQTGVLFAPELTYTNYRKPHRFNQFYLRLFKMSISGLTFEYIRNISKYCQGLSGLMML